MSTKDNLIVLEILKVVKVIMVKQKASCGAFSPGGTSLAVGMMTGGIKVFKIDGLIEQIAWCKTFGSAVRDMKYSPNGNYLAAASCDQFIDVFEVCNGYKRISRCRGHSSTVLHIDWSLTGDAIQANDQAYEVCYMLCILFCRHLGFSINATTDASAVIR